MSGFAGGPHFGQAVSNALMQIFGDTVPVMVDYLKCSDICRALCITHDAHYALCRLCITSDAWQTFTVHRKKQNVQNDTQCNLEIYTQIDVEEVALYKYCKNLAVALFASMQIVGSGTQQAAQ